MFDRLENNPVRVEACLRRSGKNREKYKKFDGFRKAATSLKAHQVICFSLSCLNIDKQLTIFATLKKRTKFSWMAWWSYGKKKQLKWWIKILPSSFPSRYLSRNCTYFFLWSFILSFFMDGNHFSSGTMQQLWQSQHGTIWRYVKLRLAFSGDGVCVVFEVVRARPIQWKLENRSCKQSHKLDGIRVERIRIV